jgi:hypothetical protein
MRCFYVLVHGRVEWPSDYLEDEEAFTPAGFYCHRYVFASGYEQAAEKAFRRVRKSLEKQTGWLKQGLAKLTLEAEELKPAPMYMLLRPKPRHDFYDNESAALAGADRLSAS